MKKDTFTRLLIVMASTLLVVGCLKDDDVYNAHPIDNETEGLQMVLGDRLENPYSVKNMQKAYSNLSSIATYSDSGLGNIEITTSHYYVKFYPEAEI